MKVCQNLINSRVERCNGRRNFFYQCFNRHWKEASKKFRFGPHSKGWKWNLNGNLITDENRNLLVNNVLQPHPAELLQLSESKSKKLSKSNWWTFCLNNIVRPQPKLLKNSDNHKCCRPYWRKMDPREELDHLLRDLFWIPTKTFWLNERRTTTRQVQAAPQIAEWILSRVDVDNVANTIALSIIEAHSFFSSFV